MVFCYDSSNPSGHLIWFLWEVLSIFILLSDD